MNAFLSAYDAVESTALARIAVYATEPWRDLKDTMELALSLAALYQMPGLPSGEKTQLATRVRRLADAVLAVHELPDVRAQPARHLLRLHIAVDAVHL